ANDAWAVGSYDNGSRTASSLIEHWNGTRWSVVSGPDLTASNGLEDVAAIAGNDVWALGSMSGSPGGSRTLVLHWDGNQWTRIPSPNTTNWSSSLEGVAAIAAN